MSEQPEIRRAAWREIVDLRHAVLRADLPREAAIFAGDELESSRHFGAFMPRDGGAFAVSCATFHLGQWESQPALQLRGMATAPDFRRKGLGRALLDLAERDVLQDKSAPRVLWCNARVPAIGFYELLGWRVVSERFEIPTAGPHVRMLKKLLFVP
ncbi:MAG TPA: GNAT family N-acetyltransferase [Tepidisphaeraceae bacterium]|nr:GNAT family N-acetyltransferase [Tepidisphaeraceae bacterium]